MDLIQETLAERYANAIHQLLPKGVVWQDKGVCTDSLLGRFIRSVSEELARFQLWLEALLKASVERYDETPTGWSAIEYEALLKQRYDIDAVVYPTGVSPMHCESGCTDALNAERSKYYFIIEVDDVSVITPDVHEYLHEYKQSHSDYIVRDRNVSVQLDEHCYEYDALTCESGCNDPLYEQAFEFCQPALYDGLHCESACTDPLYERDYAYYTINAHWSYSDEDLTRLPGWPAVAAQIPGHAFVTRGEI